VIGLHTEEYDRISMTGDRNKTTHASTLAIEPLNATL